MLTVGRPVRPAVGHAAAVRGRRLRHLALAGHPEPRPLRPRAAEPAARPPGHRDAADRAAADLLLHEGRRRATPALLGVPAAASSTCARWPASPPFLEAAPSPDPQFDLAHLWFLYYLLVWSLLLLPVFLYLRGRRAAAGGAGWPPAAGPVGVVLMAVPIAVVEAALRAPGSSAAGTATPTSCSCSTASCSRPTAAAGGASGGAGRSPWPSGWDSCPCCWSIASFDLGDTGRMVALDYDPWSLVWRLLKATAGWSLTVGLIGLAASRHPPSPATRAVGAAATVGIGAPRPATPARRCCRSTSCTRPRSSSSASTSSSGTRTCWSSSWSSAWRALVVTLCALRPAGAAPASPGCCSGCRGAQRAPRVAPRPRPEATQAAWPARPSSSDTWGR